MFSRSDITQACDRQTGRHKAIPNTVPCMVWQPLCGQPSRTFVDNKIDLSWRNFLSSEFGTENQRELPLFHYTLCHVKQPLLCINVSCCVIILKSLLWGGGFDVATEYLGLM